MPRMSLDLHNHLVRREIHCSMVTKKPDIQQDKRGKAGQLGKGQRATLNDL